MACDRPGSSPSSPAGEGDDARWPVGSVEGEAAHRSRAGQPSTLGRVTDPTSPGQQPPQQGGADHEVDLDVRAFLPDDTALAGDEPADDAATAVIEPVGAAATDDAADGHAAVTEGAVDGDAPITDGSTDDASVSDAAAVGSATVESSGDAPADDAPAADEAIDTSVLEAIEADFAEVEGALAAIDAGELDASPLLRRLLPER